MKLPLSVTTGPYRQKIFVIVQYVNGVHLNTTDHSQCRLTAFCFAMRRVGVNPNFLIANITGLYAIGMTSTGTPRFHCEKNNGDAFIAA